jgi:hypothetical protein
MHENITQLAPHPWRIDDRTVERHGIEGGYISIVDATGNRVCDFFPFAGQGGRGKEATLALAQQILNWEQTNG